jgi:hypothetical protein
MIETGLSESDSGTAHDTPWECPEMIANVIDRKGIVQQVFMAQEALNPAHVLAACALLKEVK